MKILMVNKFLYPKGGSETYIFKIGEYLNESGHEVQFFGMEHDGRIVGNHAESYTLDMDFHTSKIKKLFYPFKIIYSHEARVKIRKVLEDFKPDVVHLNNFNFQLTPSIIYEIKSFSKKTNQNIKIVFTAHDYQLICPNHTMLDGVDNMICDKCLGGKYINCTRFKCIHGSYIKSLLGTVEGYLYRLLSTYRLIDVVICPSQFIEKKLISNKDLKAKTVSLHNFVQVPEENERTEKKDYVLFFGRYSEEKGITTLIEACKQLPEITFVFAGSGTYAEQIRLLPNVKELGFLAGEELNQVIRSARFSIIASEWYENCPFSVMESQALGTPVLGANIGGIPELIQEGITGELFESRNCDQLRDKIEKLWNNKDKYLKYAKNCSDIKFDTTESYCQKLLEIYK